MNSITALLIAATSLAASISSSNQGQYVSSDRGHSDWGGSFSSQSVFGGNFKNYGAQGSSRGYSSQYPSGTYRRQGQTGWISEGNSRPAGQQFFRNYNNQKQSNFQGTSFINKEFGSNYLNQRNLGFQGVSGNPGSYRGSYSINRNQGSFGVFSNQGNLGSSSNQRYGSSFNNQGVLGHNGQTSYGLQQGFSQQRGTPYEIQQAKLLSGFRW